MALLPGSPARDAAVGSALTTDQRGFPIVGTPDIGAYEAGTLLNYNAWAYETLPASATPAQRAPTADYEQDGRSNLLEYASQTDGTQPNGGSPLTFTRNPAGTLATLVFPYHFNVPDLLYNIERSTTLTGTWTTLFLINSANITFTVPAPGASYVSNTSDSITISDTFITGQPRFFYRMRITQQP